jgi:pyrimidine operon attenuation protein / uracil phosphoribosyltransferase
MKQILDSAKFDKTLDQMVDDIARVCPADLQWAIIGIRTRGVAIAERLKERVDRRFQRNIPIGWLDITLYRDDLNELAAHPLVRRTKLEFDPTDLCVILADDVIYTGRTVRAALNALSDYGRPKYVKLAVMVDRGHRELPVCPDVTGLKIDTTLQEIVEVRMTETDAEDGVWIRTRK